jgi:hypothetical protein
LRLLPPTAVPCSRLGLRIPLSPAHSTLTTGEPRLTMTRADNNAFLSRVIRRRRRPKQIALCGQGSGSFTSAAREETSFLGHCTPLDTASDGTLRHATRRRPTILRFIPYDNRAQIWQPLALRKHAAVAPPDLSIVDDPKSTAQQDPSEVAPCLLLHKALEAACTEFGRAKRDGVVALITVPDID